MAARPSIVCAICGRTLLVGERRVRYSPDGAIEYVDVCPLCRGEAVECGWIARGADHAAGPARAAAARGLLSALFGAPPRARPEPSLGAHPQPADATASRRSSRRPTLFNGSPYRRTIEGHRRGASARRTVSIVALSGINPEVVVTVAWDISWYQYRVTLGPSQPVRLVERGFEPAELGGAVRTWNADVERRRPPRAEIAPAMIRPGVTSAGRPGLRLQTRDLLRLFPPSSRASCSQSSSLLRGNPGRHGHRRPARGPERRAGSPAATPEARRITRERRRGRLPGTFPRQSKLTG